MVLVASQLPPTVATVSIFTIFHGYVRIAFVDVVVVVFVVVVVAGVAKRALPLNCAQFCLLA